MNDGFIAWWTKVATIFGMGVSTTGGLIFSSQGLALLGVLITLLGVYINWYFKREAARLARERFEWDKLNK